MEGTFERIFLIVLDGVGAGAMPDAGLFGEYDARSNTLFHIYEQAGLEVPNLCALGLSHLFPLRHPAKQGAWGIMREKSSGKDTTIGHWELGGIVISEPFPTYPKGFPDDVIQPFCQQIGREILGNYPASGTEIIQQLGDEHVRTGKPIVYTSADSVFQIATHEAVIPVPQLYQICTIARKILTGKHAVARVIARPFTGSSGHYERTKARHDFSVAPVAPTILDFLKEAGYDAIGVGKIGDIFAEQGLTKSYPVKGNEACMEQVFQLLPQKQKGLIFVNLVDFDMLYGHRNDVQGFRAALEKFDSQLPSLCQQMHERDLLILTADHGNDPVTPSTDHSREYVPLLAYHRKLTGSRALGTRNSFADVGKTIAVNFGLQEKLAEGESFLNKLLS